jgi:hypothetical protein
VNLGELFFGGQKLPIDKKFPIFWQIRQIFCLFLDQIATCMFRGYYLIDLAKKCCQFKQILIESI